MMIQPARHECHACCPLQAEKQGIQPVVGNTRGTHVEQVVSSFQKFLRGSQLTWQFKKNSLYYGTLRMYYIPYKLTSILGMKIKQGNSVIWVFLRYLYK